MTTELQPVAADSRASGLAQHGAGDSAVIIEYDEPVPTPRERLYAMTAEERAAWIDEHHTTDADSLSPAWRAQTEATAVQLAKDLKAQSQA